MLGLERAERNERNDRNDRSERAERNDRAERVERVERNDRIDRRRAESPRELVQPQGTSTVIARPRSSLVPILVTVAIVLGAATVLYFLT
ncbi:MAG: hypothetical protein KIT31_31670 [Deltaproteobacteria bacterium]|nr:hypothetical protein [Deltaproteobacteria bacterium]